MFPVFSKLDWHMYNLIKHYANKRWLSVHFVGRRHITPCWQDFANQNRKLRRIIRCCSACLQTLQLSDCCLPGWLFTQHIDSNFVAPSSVYYQPPQTGLNLLFPLTHANREPRLSPGLPRLPQMTSHWGWLLASWPACWRQRGQAAVGRFGFIVCLGDLKVFKTVAKDYSSMLWYADVSFGDSVMQHRCKAIKPNKTNIAALCTVMMGTYTCFTSLNQVKLQQRGALSYEMQIHSIWPNLIQAPAGSRRRQEICSRNGGSKLTSK